jgi:hypothetical protein
MQYADARMVDDFLKRQADYKFQDAKRTTLLPGQFSNSIGIALVCSHSIIVRAGGITNVDAGFICHDGSFGCISHKISYNDERFVMLTGNVSDYGDLSSYSVVMEELRAKFEETTARLEGVR